MKKPSTERTSASVASLAGKLLAGKNIQEAEAWLESIVQTDDACDDNDRQHALVLLGALTAMRTLAGSALTQR